MAAGLESLAPSGVSDVAAPIRGAPAGVSDVAAPRRGAPAGVSDVAGDGGGRRPEH